MSGKSSDRITITKPAFIPATTESQEDKNTIKEYKKEFGNATEIDNVMIHPSTFLHATNSSKNWIPPYGLDSVIRLKKRMEHHEPIDKPLLFIDFGATNPYWKESYIKKISKKGVIVAHEGRHRSFTAKELGIKEIPIDVYCVKHGIFGCKKCKKITERTLLKAQPQIESDAVINRLEDNNYKQALKDRKHSEKVREEMLEIFDKK